MSDAPLDILYIGGFGRSGSTLVERCLGQLDGFCAAGELRHVWERGVVQNQLCGCGVPFRDCAFWREVMAVAFGGIDRVDGGDLVALSRRVNRTRYIPYLTLRPSAAYRRDHARFAAALLPLYRAIRQVSGCRWLIDSSKEPSYAFLLATLPGVRLSVVHLVRDSRAVAFSWMKRKEIPDVHWKRAYMHRYSAAQSAAWWAVFNGLCHVFRWTAARAVRVAYEDFARDPAAVLRRILTAIGEPPALPFLRGATATLRPNHTASGNPTRFLVGEVAIRPDEAWRSQMAPRDRRLVAALTLPLLAGYGYWERRRPARGAGG
ncbi:sulfotransferase [bacterium]|nr:sulfotransferase [bacterium]